MPRYPLRFRQSVFWGDMDALGHVNNLVFLRWFEEARIQYFKKANLSLSGGAGVILAHQRCDYLAPVRYPDEVEVRISVIKVGTSSFTMGFSIWSDVQGKEVAKGEGVGVAFDFGTGRPVPISDEVRGRIEAFERS